MFDNHPFFASRFIPPSDFFFFFFFNDPATTEIYTLSLHDALPISHVRPAIRHWMGHSVGRWEGDTLVIETTNFTNKTSYRGSGENLHLVERFTRVGPDEIDYRVTITDPTTFTRPWTIAVPYLNVGEEMYEYACHEGNYGMEGILSGGREEDRRAAEAAAKGR